MKIRVLQVLEATTGGTRRHLFDVVTRLDPQRFEVSVACSTRRDPAFANDLPALRDAARRVDLVPMVRPIRPARDLASLARLLRLLRRHPVHIVHTHSAKAGMLGRVAARLARTPVCIHTPHVFPFQMEVPALLRGLYFALEKTATRLTDRVICVCPSERKEACRLGLGAPQTFTVIENGIDAAAYRVTPETRLAARARLALPGNALLVGASGRFCRQKGQLHLVAAARHVARASPDARFALIGDGERLPAVRRRIRHAGLQDRFMLPGAAGRMQPWYAAMDVMVLPSLWEGLPYGLLEAMAAGLPVIATRVGGMPDVVRDGDNGLLVAPGQPRALAAALGRLLADPALRERLGQRAQETVRDRYRVGDMLAALETLYEESLSTRMCDTMSQA